MEVPIWHVSLILDRLTCRMLSSWRGYCIQSALEQPLSRCDARLVPPAKSLQQFDELLSELLQKIENYRAEAIA